MKDRLLDAVARPQNRSDFSVEVVCVNHLFGGVRVEVESPAQPGLVLGAARARRRHARGEQLGTFLHETQVQPLDALLDAVALEPNREGAICRAVREHADVPLLNRARVQVEPPRRRARAPRGRACCYPLLRRPRVKLHVVKELEGHERQAPRGFGRKAVGVWRAARRGAVGGDGADVGEEAERSRAQPPCTRAVVGRDALAPAYAVLAVAVVKSGHVSDLLPLTHGIEGDIADTCTCEHGRSAHPDPHPRRCISHARSMAVCTASASTRSR